MGAPNRGAAPDPLARNDSPEGVTERERGQRSVAPGIAPPHPVSLRQFCHDLSQPLMAARGSLELVQQLPADDPARAGFLADAIAALDRMSAAIEQVREE